MKVIAKKFRGVWHYGVITGVVTEWVLEDYGGATQWRAVFEDGGIVGLLRSEVVEAMAAAQEHPPVDADGEARLVTVHEGDDLSRSGKVTVQPGWVMEDCLHHMETFSILNAGPLLEEARVKAIMPEKELASPAVVRSVSRLAVLGHMYKRLQGAAWFVTRWGLQNVVTEEDGPERKAQVDALTREGRTRYPARRQGAAAGAARRQGAAAGAARRQGAAAGAARRQGAAAGAARRQAVGGRGSARRKARGGSAAPRGPVLARARQRGAKARRRAARRQGAAAGAARRQGAAAGAARRQGAAAGAARRQGEWDGRGSAAPTRVGWAGQRGAKARRPGQRGAKAPASRGSAAPRRGGRGSAAPRRGGRGSAGAKTAHTAESAEGMHYKLWTAAAENYAVMPQQPSTGFWIPLIWLAAAGCGMQGRMTEVAVLVSPESLHAAEGGAAA
eukprot:jgi/Tetstr1/431969/TSEL_021446.t1